MTTTVIAKWNATGAANEHYIGRPSRWGNPFSHKDGTLAAFKVASREEAVASYEEWILTQPELLADLEELRDKVLVCWCHPKACHGHVLARLVNERFPDGG